MHAAENAVTFGYAVDSVDKELPRSEDGGVKAKRQVKPPKKHPWKRNGYGVELMFILEYFGPFVVFCRAHHLFLIL